MLFLNFSHFIKGYVLNRYDGVKNEFDSLKQSVNSVVENEIRNYHKTVS